jgi:hypothetical protein
MSTTIEIAENLARHFIKATYKEHAINYINIEINSLYYPQSKQPLTYDIKAAIVELIERNIAHDPKCLKTFQQYKPVLLKKLNREVNFTEQNAKQEYFRIEKFKGNLSYVLNYATTQLKSLIYKD